MQNPFNMSNFRIEHLEGGNFVVKTDSERFGKDAITFESFSRNECVQYISENAEMLVPTYYIIDDLSTWSSNAPIKSKLERFDKFIDAIDAFKKHRSNVYDYSDGKAKLTLGVSVGNAELDLVHVRDGKNYLVADFFNSAAINTNKYFLNNMVNLNNHIPIDRIRLFDANGSKDIGYKDWTNSFYQDASIDEFIRTCKCCKNDMFEGYLLEESGDTYCSTDCLHTEVSSEEFDALFEAGDACWTTFPIPDSYILDSLADHALIIDDEEEGMEV